jgi:Mn2+/Fe2+ NRAMP family transporter
VLAGSAAYAIGEALGWTVGLGRKPAEARSFYGALALATLIGLALGFTPIDPMRALYWSAVVNGVLAAPLMALMMRMATDPRIMGRLALPLGLRIVGWVATAAMFATIIGLAISAV